MNTTPLIEGTDFYYDENGYMVLTEQYHLGKGYCCGYGCRHCPYNFESVPEPQRSNLLQKLQAELLQHPIVTEINNTIC